MSATSQHGFHPDAESLSAFSEQALDERERDEVLSHLAVCGRCRQVVALAREAADADAVKAPKKLSKTIEPNAWWKQWRLVWVPTAIVAAFAVASISVFVVQMDRHGLSVKNVQQNAPSGAVPASTPSPTQQAEVNKPASPAPAPPPHAAKHAHPTASEPTPAEEPPAVGAQMPAEPGATDHVESMREPPPSPAAALQAPPELPTRTTGSSYTQPAVDAWEAKQKQAVEQRQTDTSRRRFTAAKSAPGGGSGHDANGAAPPAATQSVTVAPAPPMETATAGLAQPTSRLAVNSLWKAPTPVKQIHLPSKLATVSSTSTGPFMLAIDKAGTLFLSEDQGDTWKRVHRQWKGRAVEVTQQFAANAGMQSAPATQSETAPNAPGNTNAAPPPSVIFELLNDKGQAWVSTDGRTWTAK